jgi:hypothetical protein
MLSKLRFVTGGGGGGGRKEDKENLIKQRKNTIKNQK